MQFGFLTLASETHLGDLSAYTAHILSHSEDSKMCQTKQGAAAGSEGSRQGARVRLSCYIPFSMMQERRKEGTLLLKTLKKILLPAKME